MSRGEFYGFALLAAVVGLLVATTSGGGGTLLVPNGTPMPPLMAEGWLNNAEPVTRERLAGKVVVVDCWATTCGPCRKAMPEIAELYKKYQPLGVEFLGLTAETAGDQAQIEGFIRSIDGFDWPVGYGTAPMQEMLGIRVVPTVIVFGPGGTSVWSSSDRGGIHGIEDAIEQALSRVSTSTVPITVSTTVPTTVSSE